MARVERASDLVGAQDVDVGGQRVVDAATEQFGGKCGLKLEVSNLCQRMNTGIGAAGSVEFELADARRLADRAIELALHRLGILLDLPATVASAGVLDRQLQPHPMDSTGLF